MKKEIKAAIILTVIGVGIIIGASVSVIGFNKKPKLEGDEAGINISNESSEVEEYTLEPLEDDINLEKERGKMTSYVDDNDILTAKEMMSTRNHILFTEALTNFLNKAGYPSERIIIIPEGAGYEGNTSYFVASVEGYDGLSIYIESYNSIDAFNFTLIKDGEVVVSSREEYKKDAEAYEKELEDRYNEFSATNGTTDDTNESND